MYPWTKLSAASDGAIEASIDSPEKLARPEELVGALAGDVRQMSLSASVFKFFGVNAVKRAVLTVPAHFSAQRRQVIVSDFRFRFRFFLMTKLVLPLNTKKALINAFTFGGLNVDQVIDELGAAAIDFAASHLPAKGPQSELFVIYGAGATGVSAALVRTTVEESVCTFVVCVLSIQ